MRRPLIGSALLGLFAVCAVTTACGPTVVLQDSPLPTCTSDDDCAPAWSCSAEGLCVDTGGRTSTTSSSSESTSTSTSTQTSEDNGIALLEGEGEPCNDVGECPVPQLACRFTSKNQFLCMRDCTEDVDCPSGLTCQATVGDPDGCQR